MESRNYDCLEKGHVSNETVLPPDSIVRSKNSLIGYENCCDMLVFNQQSNDNQGLLEVGFSETMRNTLSRDSLRNSVGCNGSDVDISNPILVTSDAISGYENVSSISVVDSNSQESSVIDLKLGRIGDNLNFSSFRAASILSSAESSTPAKKGRASSLSSRAGFCQVYGCNKDLSLSKDYHKRHQVCEAHSKTARVIVNAMEQRFCQQCSRFHLLAEFDDGKRSCRKRLSGHNERRRKPQVGLHSGRTGRLLHAYRGSAGSKFQGTTSTATSFICQDISPKSLFQVQKYEKSSWDKQIKLEDGMGCAPKLGNTCRNGQIQQKPVSSRVFDCTSNTSTASVSIENTDQYQVNTGSLSLFQNTFLGNKDLTHLDAASTAQVLNDMPDAGCALSLLSAQSRNSSGHSSGILTDHPIITESPFGVGFLALTSGMSNKCSLYRFGSARRNNLCPMPVLDNDNNINFPYAQEILQGSKFASGRDPLSCEDGSTIDLLQLSSQLQQVENQR